MSKFYLTKIFTFIILTIFLIGFIFFPKEKYNTKPIEEQLITQQEEIQDEKVIKELTEEDRVKTIAETFASIYYSYTWGEFSNIESQYQYMTTEMEERERIKVERIKKEIDNQSLIYFTARAKLTNSYFIAYSETTAILKINLSIDNFAGAIVQRDTMVWVDEKGDYYGRDTKDLIVNTIDKNIEVILTKTGDEWKVDEIGEIELGIMN